ncbi:MAG: NADPH-dependent F420 reductase [Gaiellaceae bacterium]
MRIAAVGRGNVGGGLARRWRAAGHDVTEIGRDGGDVSDAEVVVVAVPAGQIAEALGGVTGLAGKPVIDTTNFFSGERPPFDSLAHQVQSITGGPVAKSFNLNYAALYDQIDAQDQPPAQLFAADEGAREVAEQLIRDAGFEPVYAGGLENARVLEDAMRLWSAVSNGGLGRFFHRFFAPS